jgi:hypothetical protein
MAGEASSAVRGASLAAPTISSSGSADSYDGSDARRFLRQRNEVCDFYSEATCKVGRLEFCVEATQAELSTTEGETSTTHALLVDTNARVVGRISVRPKSPFFGNLPYFDWFPLLSRELWRPNSRPCIWRQTMPPP